METFALVALAVGYLYKRSSNVHENLASQPSRRELASTQIESRNEEDLYSQELSAPEKKAIKNKYKEMLNHEEQFNAQFREGGPISGLPLAAYLS